MEYNMRNRPDILAAGHFTRRLALGTALMLALAGCQTTSVANRDSDLFSTASTGEASLKDTAAAGKRWQADRKDIRLGMAYARQLQALGQTQKQMKVLDELAGHHPHDMRLQTYYGKQLVRTGQSSRAVPVLQSVVKSGKADWKTYSALGSALDQTSRHVQARQYYETALQSKPGEVTIMNNIGMSHLLEGNLQQAEVALKKANEQPGSQQHPRVRQNPALAVGLQGRFDEARDIASRDLPPEQVEANLAFLKKMMSQNNTWQKLQPAKSG
jgi:Flp pilus assembly protein TadD